MKTPPPVFGQCPKGNIVFSVDGFPNSQTASHPPFRSRYVQILYLVWSGLF